MFSKRRLSQLYSICVGLIIVLLAGCNWPGFKPVAPSIPPVAAPIVVPNTLPAPSANQPVTSSTSETVPLAGDPSAGQNSPDAPKTIVTPLPDIKPDNDFLKFVPAGPYKMGSTQDDIIAVKDELPQHTLDISPFWIYKAEVTNSMYAECVKAGKCAPPIVGTVPPSSHYPDPNFAKWPVVGVDWYNAAAYCKFADARLPTEAEWEKTARGTQTRVFPWGNDAPTCDLLNMKDCVINPPDTDIVNHFPVGRSQYKVVDMAGNVREWVHDWYQTDYYINSPGWDPQGPITGTLKVIRGGGFKDPSTNVRNTSRFSALPKDTFDDVGFRCIPIGQTAGGSAPFCKASYKPFCEKPGQTPCAPVVQKIPGKPTVNEYSCPKDQNATIMITSGFVSAEGASVTINGIAYDCHTDSGYPDRLICTGAPLAGNSYASVQICLNGGNATALIQNEMLPVSFVIPSTNNSIPGKALIRPGLENFLNTVSLGGEGGSLCQDGWEQNDNGVCVPIAKDKCPNGWTWNSHISHCIPTDKTSCPKGSNPVPVGDLFFCAPVNNQCPTGYNVSTLALPIKSILATAPVKYCYPFKEDGPCQQGYRFSADSNCCEPIPADNLGCEPGRFYRNINYNRCIPIKGDGCSYGEHFVYGKGCVKDYNPGDGKGILVTEFSNTVQNTCPFGLVDDGKGNCVISPTDCLPPMIIDEKGVCSYPDQNLAAAFDYTADLKCLPGETLVGDQCVPDIDLQGNIDCGSGFRYISALGICANNDEKNCRRGTYLDPKSGSCLPLTGPGSPCAYGYIYNQQTKCCVPIPGTQGSTCPRPTLIEEKPLPVSSDTSTLGTPPIMGDSGVVALLSNDLLTANTNFDPMSGICYPDPGQPCPPGYLPKGDTCVLVPVNANNCPTGTTPDEVVCNPDSSGTCPLNRTLDTSNNSCAMILQPFCPPDTIAENGNCYPLQGKNCPDGTTPGKDSAGAQICVVGKSSTPSCDEKTLYLAADLGICVPRTPGCCRPGYNYDKEKNICVPIKIISLAPQGKECMFGTEWNVDKQQCVPISTDNGQTCVTVRFSVPVCNGPCLAPLQWNGSTCIEPGPTIPKPGKKTNPCLQWGSDAVACKRHNCSFQNDTCG